MRSVSARAGATAVTVVAAALVTITLSDCGSSGARRFSGAAGAQAVANHIKLLAGGAAATTLAAGGRPPALPIDSDGDNDNPTKSSRDKDDKPPLPGGRPPSASERQAIVALLKGYYAAATAADGASACSRLYTTVRQAVPEDYGRTPGPPKLRGATCAIVLSKLFAEQRRELRIKSATLAVQQVLIKGDRGVAMLRFGPAIERFENGRDRRVTLHREKGAWVKAELFDVPVVG